MPSGVVNNFFERVKDDIDLNWRYELRHSLYSKKAKRISKSVIRRIIDKINLNSKELDKLRKVIDSDISVVKIKEIKHIHAHFSGIEYTLKGEKKHLLTQKKDIIPLAKQIIKRKVDITIINESPQPLQDALKTRDVFKSLS